MITIEIPEDSEVVIEEKIDVTSSSDVEVEVVDLDELDITVAKKEFVITGDDIYIPMLYDDAPQWMKDLVQVVVDVSVESGNTGLINQMNELLSNFATSYVPLNQYTQSIMDLSNADESIHVLVETLNSNYNDGISEANSQIIELKTTKASKTEVVTQIIQTLSAELENENSVLGATVARLDQAIVNESSARAQSVETVMASLESIDDTVSGEASATNQLYAYVGYDRNGGETGTGLLADVQILQKQNDGVIETVTGTYDVMINPENPELAELILTAEPYASWRAADVTGVDTRLAHIGDVYIKYRITDNGAREYIASFKFIRTVVDASDAYKSTDADGFTWAMIIDQAAQDAYNQALSAYDLADGKRRVFVGLGATTTPKIPYEQGDLWLIDTARTVNGYSAKVGDILRCIEPKIAEGATYEQNDWVLASSYSNAIQAEADALENWKNTTYANTITAIQTQIDKKAETFYQNSVPTGRTTVTNVVSDAELDKYVGDLWKNTYVGTIGGYLGNNTEYIYSKIANGSKWDYKWVRMEVPDIVFDTIDTKKSIYSGNSVPVIVAPDELQVNDMWITGDNPVTPYSAKSIYVWNGSAWAPPLRYTDDQYARSIVEGTTQIDLSEHINSLGWTDDSTVDDFIVSTYAKDMLNIGNQLDGVAVTYFQTTKPYLESAGLSEHSGDVWFNTSNETAFRFMYKIVDASGTVVTPSAWVPITNSVILSSLKAASKTKAAADRSIKNFTTTTVPAHPFYIGDTWMEGSSGNIYVCNSNSLSADTEAQRRAKWVIASKYTDDTAVTALQTGLANGTTTIKLTNAYVGTVPLTTYLSSEIDNKVGVYSGTTAPVAGQPSGVAVNDIYLWFTTQVASGKTYDITRTYKYNGSAWNEITTNDDITNLADLADGKRTIFGGNVVPTGAVERDLWIPSADVSSYVKGEIYQYISGVWSPTTRYTADIQALTSNVQAQIDSKVDTYYQDSVPFANATNVARKTQAGDYWYCTLTADSYVRGKIYKYVETANGSNWDYTWTETANVTKYAFDVADGKASIFTTSAQPSSYKINDMLIVTTASFSNGTTTFSNGVVLTSNATRTSGFVDADWVKKINDTEDLDVFIGEINPKVTSLQNQLDGKIEYYFKDIEASPNLPAQISATWGENEHGNVVYYRDTEHAYWYNGRLKTWETISDVSLYKALQVAEKAEAAVDGVVVSFYAYGKDTQTSVPTGVGRYWFKKDTKQLYKYTTEWTLCSASGTVPDINIGDTVLVPYYDSTNTYVDTYTYTYLNSTSGWITLTENGMVASSESITKLKAYLGTDGGTSTLVNDITAKTTPLGKSVDARFAYNTSIVIDGVTYSSGFGLATSATSGSGLTTGQSEFWIKADKFKLISADGSKKSAYSPFSVDTTTGAITFNGKVTFSNVTDVKGTGNNVLYNSQPRLDMETKGWSVGWSNHGKSSWVGSGHDTWRPTGSGSVYIVVDGGPALGSIFDINNRTVPVIAGQRYEASAYLSAHRCYSYVTIAWFDSNGGYISESGGSQISVAHSGPLSNWGRSTLFAVAPAGAVTGRFYVRSVVNDTSNAPYCFVAYAYMGKAETNQTIYSDWSEGTSVGLNSGDVVADVNAGTTTTINGGRITTGSITANQVNLNDLFAQNITYTGVITGGNVAGGGIIQSYNGKMRIDLVNGSIYIA